MRAGGRVEQARAAREVIVAGGTINSPQILMLSGIGPADHLRQHGIAVVQDLPGVGQNLQDHIETYVQHRCLQPITLYPVLKDPLRQLLVGIEWTFFGSGIGATNHFEAGGFIRSHAGVEHPDLQYHFLPIARAMTAATRRATASRRMSARCGRPRRLGDAAVGRSAAGAGDSFNYLQTEQDRLEFRGGQADARDLAQQAFDPLAGRSWRRVPT